MEEKIFVGYGFGRFQNEKGRMQEYCNVFVNEPFTREDDFDHRSGGMRSAKYKCINSDAFKDIPTGSTVHCYFDSYGRICDMVIADAK